MNSAIIGCGKVADAHAFIISSMKGCTVSAFCDTEELMASQMSERFKGSKWYTDVNAMLTETKPDVVHITTPPLSHYSIAKKCLEQGCSVYVEKPFTLNTKEAEELISIANSKSVKITVGTNIQYSRCACRIRELVRKGFLGGDPVHLESMFCYSLEDHFAKAFLGDKNHWVRKLPGQLFHNIISHGIARIAEYLTGEDADVFASSFSSQAIQALGCYDVPDELRVIIKDANGVSAYFTFSSQINPCMHKFYIYGPKRSLLADDDFQTVTKISNLGYKSYLNYFIPPLKAAKQNVSNTLENLNDFIKRKIFMDAGKGELISEFYKSISNNTPPPISYREMLLTSRIMDRIFSQINSKITS